MKQWLIEFAQRFALKTPKFFQYLQYAAIVATAVSGVPYLLQQVNHILTEADLKTIDLPKIIIVLSNKAVFVAAGITWLMAKLPVKPNDPKLESDQKLPFTKAEVKKES